jgi:hypothetical protein
MASAGVPAHPESELSRPELEHPWLAGRNVWLGSRVISACIAFYFLSFLFAYVYLKTLNVNRHWRLPRPALPSIVIGVLVLVLVLAGTALLSGAVVALQGERWQRWRSMLWLSLLAFLVATVLLVVQLVHPEFPYAVDAYATVFVGWYWSMVLLLLGLAYYVATLAAQSHRVPPESRAEAEDLSSPVALQISADGVRFAAYVTAGIEVIAFVLLYLIR